MKHSVQTIYSSFEGFKSIANIASEVENSHSNSVELDFSYCDFFEANMAAPLHVVASQFRQRGYNVSYTNWQPQVKSILQKNKFLSPELPDINQTTFPFQVFTSGIKGQFYTYLSDHMKGKDMPQMSSSLVKEFHKSLHEIAFNAIMHANSTLGFFVCGQFFPTKKRVDFTIADAGVGIPENVRQHTKNMQMTSEEAIKWALIKGNTTQKQMTGGLGLELIREFIKMNKGRLQIVSDDGYYQFSPRGERFDTMIDKFPGTCINIEINTKDTSSYCLKSEPS